MALELVNKLFVFQYLHGVFSIVNYPSITTTTTVHVSHSQLEPRGNCSFVVQQRPPPPPPPPPPSQSIYGPDLDFIQAWRIEKHESGNTPLFLEGGVRGSQNLGGSSAFYDRLLRTVKNIIMQFSSLPKFLDPPLISL